MGVAVAEHAPINLKPASQELTHGEQDGPAKPVELWYCPLPHAMQAAFVVVVHGSSLKPWPQEAVQAEQFDPVYAFKCWYWPSGHVVHTGVDV